MADGGGHNAPLYAAAPTVLSGLAAWAAQPRPGRGPHSLNADRHVFLGHRRRRLGLGHGHQ